MAQQFLFYELLENAQYMVLQADVVHNTGYK